MNRTRIHRIVAGSMVAAGVASVLVTVALLCHLANPATVHLSVMSPSGLALATLPAGMLTLLNLEMARRQARSVRGADGRPAHATVSAACAVLNSQNGTQF